MSSAVVSAVIPVVPVVSDVSTVSSVSSVVNMREKLMNDMVASAKEVAIECVRNLGEKYGFDADMEIMRLGLNILKMSVSSGKSLSKKSLKSEKSLSKKSLLKKSLVKKSAFPLPYNGNVNEDICHALRQNNGLYTQCIEEKNGESVFCKKCESAMQKKGLESPEFGTIEDRKMVDIMDYTDPKGRKPIHYSKIMKKLNLTEEQVREEASKEGIVLKDLHFEVQERKRGRPSKGEVKSEKGPKGRPKKSDKVLALDGEDLFATLVAEANESDPVEPPELQSVVEEEVIEISPKEAEKKKKDAEKAEKAAKKEADRLAKEEEKKKKDAEKAEKAAKKEADRLAKEEEKKKKEEEKKKKEAEKASKKEAKKKEVEVEDTDDEEPEIVKKIEFEGKKYLKSKNTGIVYDYEKYAKEGEQVVVGKWDDVSQKIVFEDAEESEDEYDEE